jgi:acyl dehydratase
MALDPKSVGYTTREHSFTYDWRTLASYALGIGAKRSELPYLYENTAGGMRVYPTFAVVPVYDAVVDLLARSEGDMAMVVHGGQEVVSHRPIPPAGTVVTVGTLTAIYDLKKFAQLILSTHTTMGGEPVFDTTWSIIIRGAGGFGGERPPPSKTPGVPKDRAPDWEHVESTTPEQALLYRISGDVNPLHADPQFAEQVGFPQGPILHGLCTYGFAGRAIVAHAASGSPERVKRIACQFRKPVWPGDTIVTQGWTLDDGIVAFQTSVRERPDPVLTGAWAEIG